jgi:DNA-binding NtrC family response regulator
MRETVTLGPPGGNPAAGASDFRTLVREYERRLIQFALDQTNGNQRRAAAKLGVRPSTLHEKLKRLAITISAPNRRS